VPTFISHSPAETEALGFAWASECAYGWVIGLSGPLGAGKTQLVKGLARGLNTAAPVVSPAYSLVHEYPGGRLPLFHLDLYRLDTRDQIIAAGLESYLIRPEGVSVVEWIERWIDPVQIPYTAPGPFRRVQFKTLGETAREISYEDFGVASALCADSNR
jgi:tRNA threonylcarbamoyladenosine biosynthesis protein TsaE